MQKRPFQGNSSYKSFTGIRLMTKELQSSYLEAPLLFLK